MKDGKGTVLVVDDDAEALSLLTGVLENEGYRVQPADSGKLALVSVAAQPPDLVLLDVRMPGMDGFEVCRRLKRTETDRRVPVIFVSASRDKQEWADGLSLGAADFVSKPFQREELLARVKTHIELGRLQANLEALVARRTAELRYAVEQMRVEMAVRHRAEQALRESEARFRHIANAAPVIIWTSDASNHVDFRNDHAATFTGRAMNELMEGGWDEAVHPDDRAGQEATFARVMETRERFQFEYRLRRADGTFRDMLDMGTPRFLENGEFAGFIGIVFDLTDVKGSQEQAFRQKNLENLHVLSAGIAHDFNSLIGAIFGEADLALSDMEPDAPGRANVERIDGIARRAADIVRLLMAYVGEQSDPGTSESVDLSAVVREIVPHLKAARFKRVEIRMDLAPKLPPVWMNLAQFRLVLLNLIINAAEATKTEDGLVSISTKLVQDCAGRADQDEPPLCHGAFVALEISDNGAGMTEEVQARVFDPYFTTKVFGRGLGLASVHGIIRSHHGSISVRSSVGSGSMFEVRLPVARRSLVADE